MLLPHVTKQILFASTVDFKHLLQYKSIKFADFTDAEFRNQASNLSLGCCVVVWIKGLFNIKPDVPKYYMWFTSTHFFPHSADNQKAPDLYEMDASTIAIGCWRGRNSISVMVTAIDCQELLERMPMHLETELPSLEDKKSSC